MNPRRYELEFDAEFGLIYLVGKAPDAGTSPPELTHAESRRMLGSRDGAIAIFTARERDVPVAVEICESAPVEDFDGWEHVVEAAICVGGDGLRLGSDAIPGFEEAKRFDLEPGTYCVTVDPQTAGNEAIAAGRWTTPLSGRLDTAASRIVLLGPGRIVTDVRFGRDVDWVWPLD